jgi:hypothetical protein
VVIGGVVFVLARANQLDGVPALAQLVDQLGQGQRHTIDFGWPRFCDHRNAHGGVFWLDVFDQNAVVV